MSQKALRFVQRGRILLRCGSAFALSLPSLGVSSLDLGRLFIQAALFSWGAAAFLELSWCHLARPRRRDDNYHSAADANGSSPSSGSAASTPARTAKSLATWANRSPRDRRRSSM